MAGDCGLVVRVNVGVGIAIRPSHQTHLIRLSPRAFNGRDGLPRRGDFQPDPFFDQDGVPGGEEGERGGAHARGVCGPEEESGGGGGGEGEGWDGEVR